MSYCFSRNLFFCCIFLLFACRPPVMVDYKRLPAITERGINMVVEIPAGTNHKIEYNPDTQEFENDLIKGEVRVIDFLPYPGNYGFIPSTQMEGEKGGDGDALDILLIAESLETGTVIEVIPIGALMLKDNEEVDTKIIAVPAEESKRVIRADDFVGFTLKYGAVKQIIEYWFLHYKGLGQVEMLGWKPEDFAYGAIRKWQIETTNEK